MRTPSIDVKFRKKQPCIHKFDKLKLISLVKLVACLNGKMNWGRTVVAWAKEETLPPIVFDRDTL